MRCVHRPNSQNRKVQHDTQVDTQSCGASPSKCKQSAQPCPFLALTTWSVTCNRKILLEFPTAEVALAYSVQSD